MKGRSLTLGHLVTPTLLVGVSIAVVILFTEATIAIVARDTPRSVRLTLLAVGAFLTTALTVPVVYWLVVEPLRRMRYMIDLMTEGDFTVRTGARGRGLAGQTLRALDDLAGIFEARWEAARAAEHRYHLLYDLSPAALFRTRADGRVLEFNQAALRLLGYDSAIDVKTRNARALYAHPEDHDRVLAQFARDGAVTNLLVQLRRKDGAEIPALMSLGGADEGHERHIDGQLIDAREPDRVEAR